MGQAETASRGSESTRLSRRILAGATAGILCGVFLGEFASVLEPIGGIYIALLQMVVFPFLVSSLLHGLGSMNPAMALRLLRRGLPVFLLAWAVVLLVLWIASLAIPAARPPIVVTAGASDTVSRIVSLLIPANPFTDLTHNYVPAIVIFCVIYGIAIQSQKGKSGLLGIFEVVKGASIAIWGWVIKLAPLGVFALFADLAGTIRVELLGSLFLYLLLFFGAALLISFWILPALLSAFIPVRHREILAELRTALVMAVATSLPITAVPFIVQLAERLVTEVGGKEKDEDAVVSTSLAVGYPITQAGNLFVFLFMAFAIFYFQAAQGPADWLALPVLTLLSTVGTPVATVDAVEFLAKWMNLPPEASLLYVEMFTITRYPQVLASAMGIAFVTILTPFAYYGLVRFQPAKFLRASGVAILGLAALVVAGTFAGKALAKKTADPYRDFTLDPSLTAGVNATVRKEPAAPAHAGRSSLDRIRASGTLRVGYAPHVIPFSYFNNAGELVGYDIAYAYALARDLNVDLELVPFTDWSRLNTDLAAGAYDIAVGGIFLTAARLREATASRPYLQSQPALIVRDHDAARFLDGRALRQAQGLRIAAFSSDILVPLARTLFPKGDVVVVPDYEALLHDPSIDAALWTLDQARAWAASHPGFSAVVPSDFGTPFLMAYLMPPDSREFAVLVDQWLELQTTNGFQAAAKSYWLEAKPRTPQTPRWSILRNVLKWPAP
jgi:Na+/H+-dicarboxylate symporter/ABC-type amino acid transport substrate-binding protein